jgi:predicted RNA-binding Zn ribbon-like protein
MSDEGLLLALLNTTPVIDGVPADELASPRHGRRWLVTAGGRGNDEELRHVRETRAGLQAVVRGEQPPEILASALEDAVLYPDMSDGGISWTLRVPPDRELAARAVLAWDALAQTSPGRLRPCANEECQLFLIDRSKAGTARWCSMAICGNRMKARRHYQRTRNSAGK